MAALCNYTLSYDVAGAISAQYPVGYTLTMMLLVGALVTYNYMFVGTTIKRLMSSLDSYWLGKTDTFYGIDFGLFGVLGGWGVLFIVLVAFGYTYYFQCYTAADPYYSRPLEIVNIVLFALFLALLWGDRMVQFSDIRNQRANLDSDLTKGATQGRVEENPARLSDTATPPYKWGAWVWMTYWRPMILAAACLFLGSYAQIQQVTTPGATYCGAPTGSPAVPPPCWSASAGFFPVAQFCVASGVILAYGLLAPLWYGKDSQGNFLTSKCESAVFGAGEGEDLNTAYFLGWVPTYPLRRWWIIAYCLFFPLAITLVGHDYVKGVMVAMYACVVPIFLMLLAQDTSYFFPFHVASVVVYLFLAVFTTGMITPLQPVYVGDTAGLAMVANWGAYLTGPDTYTNINADTTWINAYASITLFVCILSHFNVMESKSVYTDTKVSAD